MRSRPLTILAVLALVAGAVALRWLPPASAAGPELSTDLARFDPALSEAFEAARDAVAGDPESAAAWGRLGLVYEANLVPDLAVGCYRRANELAPTDARWAYRRGVLTARRGELVEARAALEVARDARPEHGPAHWRLAQVYLESGELDLAEATFRHALLADDRDPAGWAGIGRVALQRDRPEDAARAFRAALSLRPGDRYVHGLLGTAYRRSSRLLDAAEHLELGLGAAPRWADAWDAEVLEARVETAAMRQVLAARLLDGGLVSESLEKLETLRREGSTDLKVLTGLGTAYGRLGRLEDACDAYDAALAIEPESRLAHVNLAATLGRLGRFDDALEHVDAVVRKSPNFARAHEIRGTLLYRLGEPAKAIEAYREALRHDARDANVALGLGMLELELQRWEDAARTLRSIVDEDRHGGDAWLGLAKAELMRGRLDEASAALRRAERSEPSNGELLQQVRTELESRTRAGARR